MGFDPSYKGIGEMLCAPWMEADMLRRAENVARRAEATAPYDPDGDDGHYKDAFEVTSGVGGRKTKRAFGKVSNTDEAAIYVEYGTERVARHRTLGRALDAAKE